jgi:hypothetical protein
MSTYNLSDIRKLIDDLDEIIRASVIKGDIAAVFEKERATLVSKVINLVTIDTKSLLG